MTTGNGREAMGSDEIMSREAVNKLHRVNRRRKHYIGSYITSALLPLELSFLCLHSALKSFKLRGRYLDARESRRAEGLAECAVELIPRIARANLVTGGVTLDMVVMSLRLW